MRGTHVMENPKRVSDMRTRNCHMENLSIKIKIEFRTFISVLASPSSGSGVAPCDHIHIADIQSIFLLVLGSVLIRDIRRPRNGWSTLWRNANRFKLDAILHGCVTDGCVYDVCVCVRIDISEKKRHQIQ